MYTQYYYSYPEQYYDNGFDSAFTGGFLGFLAGFFATMWLLCLVCAVIQLIGQWVTYKKAGLDGWEALVPGHNVFVKFKLAGIHTGFYFLLLVPIANIVVDFWLNIEFAKSFGRSVGFGIGLTLLPVIFYPILGFGKSTYIGPSSNNNNNNNNYNNNNNDNNTNNNTMNVNSEERKDEENKSEESKSEESNNT